MQSFPVSPNVIRFGSFEADLSARELRKRGRKIPLQDQPFRVLALLLQRPGELVSREEFQRALWPGDTFVEFDEGLNKAIQKLRQALEDSSGNPRFIETLPRKGYRFIAPVDRAAGEPVAAEAQSTSMSSNAGSTPTVGRSKRRSTEVLAWVLFGVVSVVLVVLAGVYFRVFRPDSRPLLKTVPLTSYPGHQITPGFSPDGKQVAFSWEGEKGDNLDLYVMLVTAGEPLKLTSNPANEVWPTWSPDGGHIAFCRDGPSIVEIWTIPALGGAERKLGESEKCAGLSWSPNGKFLAMVDRGAPQGPWQIFLLSVDTGEKRRLTSPPGEYAGDFEPKFSPDGLTLAFARGAEPRNNDVYVLSVTASGRPVGEPRRLTFNGGSLSDLDWTADGRRIVYSLGQIGSSSLWTIEASGGTPQRLSVAGENPSTLSVSRAGSRLVYEHNVHHSSIWQIPGPNSPEKTSASKKFIASTQVDLEPQFSPDGRKITFSSARSGSVQIWVCDREGRNAAPLTSFNSPELGSPRWSPNSRWIAYDSSEAGNSDIYVISADGGQPRRMTTGPANNERPSWSRDGRSLYFGSNRSGDWQIWKQPTDGGAAVQVTKTKQGAEEAFESPNGKFVYYATSSAPGVWKVPVEGGEETRVIEQGGQSLWTMTEQGICFFDLQNPIGAALKFYSFAAGKITLLRHFPKDTVVDVNSSGLSVSPDGREILYTQIEESSDLMLVENFR